MMNYPDDYINKIIHGDCLDVMKDIPDSSIDMILADLPYGSTACKWDIVIPFDLLWKQYKKILRSGGVIALFGSEPFASFLRLSNIDWYKYDWVWNKNRATNFVNAKIRPLSANETISVFGNSKSSYYPQKAKNCIPTNSAKGAKQAHIYRGKETWNYNGGDTERFPRTDLYFKVERGLHPTQKPVSLCEYLIKTYTNENNIVLDNVIGSGTTAVACINTNRNFIGIEKEKKYVKIANERISKIGV